MAIKESSFCIVEFSLSPISKFIHSPNYVATTSFQALVLTIGGSSVFHYDPLRPTVYGLWSSLLRRRICLKSRYNSNFTHSIPHRGLEYPVLFYRWSLLSVERTANCGAIVWLNGPSNVKFFDFSPPQFSCGEPRGLLVILDKPWDCTNPSIIYSRFMSKTEVVHWRFDCRVYVFVDCSFPLLILSAVYLYCYHWSFALPFTVRLI